MALITTLMMSVVLLMMVISLVKAVTTQNSQTRGYHDNVAALYVAESGLADVMSRLELDGDWRDGFNGESMQGRPGNYWVKFHTSPGPAPDDASINNISGVASRIGPRGRVVPRGSALIVVTAKVGSAQRQLEAIVNSSGVINVEYPMMTSGSIGVDGATTVDGIRSLNSFERVAAGVHSNARGGAGPTIKWEPGPAVRGVVPKASITGKVSSVDPRPSGIDFGSDPTLYNVGAFERDAAHRQFPRMGDIARQVDLHSGSPEPTIEVAGTTTLATGDYYKSGDLTVNGDLLLDGGELFVDGDLVINGGISGQGAIWASGKVTFKGDSSLQSSEKAAVMSKKGVDLLGFDGDDYMEGFAESDPEVRLLWDATKEALGNITTMLENEPPATILGDGGRLDEQARILGNHPENVAPIPVVNPEDALVGGDYLGKLETKLAAQSEGPSRDFMLRKLADYRGFFSANTEPDELVATRFSNRPRVLPGAFDAVVDSQRESALGKLMVQVSSVSYDKAGSSYFQGVIYTNGHFFASNSVTTLGAIMVDGQGREGSEPNPLDPTETFKPGQLVMRRGANMTFVEEFFEEGENALRIRGPVQVRTWVTR